MGDLFGVNCFLILGLFDLMKPLAQVSQPSEVICRWFCFVEVPGATRAKSVWELHWELCSQWMWNEGHSWSFSAFWIHFYSSFFLLRNSSHCLASGKLSGPLGPFQCWSCLGTMFFHFWWFKSLFLIFLTFWVEWQRFQNQLRSSSPRNSPCKSKGPPGPIGEKYCIRYNFTV